MRYRLLGKTGVRLSEVALGTMTFGQDWGWGAPPDVSARMLDLFADAGGNVIDTADVYTNGSSETIVGELLKGRRDRFVLATKFLGETGPTARWLIDTGTKVLTMIPRDLRNAVMEVSSQAGQLGRIEGIRGAGQCQGP